MPVLHGQELSWAILSFSQMSAPGRPDAVDPTVNLQELRELHSRPTVENAPEASEGAPFGLFYDRGTPGVLKARTGPDWSTVDLLEIARLVALEAGWPANATSASVELYDNRTASVHLKCEGRNANLHVEMRPSGLEIVVGLYRQKHDQLDAFNYAFSAIPDSRTAGR